MKKASFLPITDWRRAKPRPGEMWYAYCQSPSPSTWYNNETYVNTLSKAAIDRFIDITYNAYLNSGGR